MSEILPWWRCRDCGGRVHKKAAEATRHSLIFCNYTRCLNNPRRGGGDVVSDKKLVDGNVPDWVVTS